MKREPAMAAFVPSHKGRLLDPVRVAALQAAVELGRASIAHGDRVAVDTEVVAWAREFEAFLTGESTPAHPGGTP